MSPPFTIASLVEQQALVTYFQPIVSVRKQEVIGMEALSRGIDAAGNLIPAPMLFARAEAEGASPALDRMCREKALDSFQSLHRANPKLILFLNVHASTIDSGDNEDGLMAAVRRRDIDPRVVALEILESAFTDTERFQTWVQHYKENGYLVALDDVGAGHSNLNRILHVRPDILKIDQFLLRNLHQDYAKQQVFASLFSLSEKIGGWTITEGVESEEEALCALELGGDMFQGYHFARPAALPNMEGFTALPSLLHETGAKFRAHALEQMQQRSALQRQRRVLLGQIAQHLKSVPEAELERALAERIVLYPEIESAALLNTEGIQISDTALNLPRTQKQKTIIFRPPACGADHSLKSYYYGLMDAKIDPFETNPYVPLPSGDLCITLSTQFNSRNRVPYILCLHLHALESELDAPNF